MSVLSKLDENKIEMSLYSLIKTVYEGEVFCSNYPNDNFHADEFIVVKGNGGAIPLLTNNNPAMATRSIMIQLYVKKSSNGFKNMGRMIAMRDLVIELSRSSQDGYYFEYLNDIGSKDTGDFSVQYINFNCTILK